MRSIKKTDKKRNHIAVYVTDDELREVKGEAREAKLSLCEFVRRKIWLNSKHSTVKS